MASDRPRVQAPVAAPEHRVRRGQSPHEWRTQLTCIEPNKILVRGYALDEMMGRLGFSDSIYLLLTGELPTRSIGRLMSAIFVSGIDHGVTPPSTLAARNVATTGAAIGECVSAGIAGFGPWHGGDVATTMRLLDAGLALMRGGMGLDDAARQIVDRSLAEGEVPPGFGHRYHTRDPRAGRLLQMALELELEGEHARLLRAMERALQRRIPDGETPTINIDGAIAAVCGDLGFDPEMGTALFLISRVPGLVAHAREERLQPRMRQIDPTAHVYEGPRERRLPEGRK